MPPKQDKVTRPDSNTTKNNMLMRLPKGARSFKKARFTFNFAFLGCSMLPSPTFSASPFYFLSRKGWRIFSVKIWIFETLCWVKSKNYLSTKSLLPVDPSPQNSILQLLKKQLLYFFIKVYLFYALLLTYLLRFSRNYSIDSRGCFYSKV